MYRGTNVFYDLSHAQALILLVNDMHKRAILTPAAESFYGSGNAKGNFLYQSAVQILNQVPKIYDYLRSKAL